MLNFNNWLNESTLNDLYLSTVNAAPKTTLRQHAIDPVRITQLSIMPFRGMKTVVFKGLAENQGKHYNSIIMFKEVDFNGDIKVAGDYGPFNIKILSPEQDVVLRCSCPDFYWRGVYANYLDNSLYGGNRKKYEGLGLLPPVNPEYAPMMCKHLIKLSKALQESGILMA